MTSETAVVDQRRSDCPRRASNIATPIGTAYASASTGRVMAAQPLNAPIASAQPHCFFVFHRSQAQTIAYALTKLTAADEKKLRALVKKAVS